MDEALESRLDRVLKKLKDFRTRNAKQCRQEKHGFKLGPRLRELEISTFEQKVGARLPEAYRQFLLIAGDGGAGPAYGLLPFSKWSQWAIHAEKRYGAGYMVRSCPIWPGMPECVGDQDRSTSLWDDLCAGTLTILEAGCSDFVLLIITGKYRGRVVHIEAEKDGREGGPYVTRDVDFLAWYERWLDAICWGWDVRGFGPGLPGDMPRMLEVLKDGKSPHANLEEALHTIRYAPTLLEGMETPVVDLLRSPSKYVQLAAIWAVEKHQPESSAGPLRSLLLDRDPEIRRASVFTLGKTRPAGWIDDLRPMLRDAEHEVMFPALCSLIDIKALRQEDLRPLIESDVPENRSSGLYAWGKSEFSIEGESWVDARMNDENSMVRYEFFRAAERAKPPNFKAILSSMQERHPNDPWFQRRINKTPSIGEASKGMWKAVQFVGSYLIW